MSPSGAPTVFETSLDDAYDPGCRGGRRAKRSLPVPLHKSTPHHLPPDLILIPQKVVRGYAMMSPIKRGTQFTLLRPQQSTLPEKLGEHVAQDATLVEKLGWEKFVKERKGQGDLTELKKAKYLDLRLLQ